MKNNNETKKQIKETFRTNGFKMIESLEACGMAFVKTQSSKNGIHTKRAYVRISEAQDAIKSCKASNNKKIANTLFELIKELRKETDSLHTNYMSIIATGNGRTFGFSINKPLALVKRDKEFDAELEALKESEEEAKAVTAPTPKKKKVKKALELEPAF